MVYFIKNGLHLLDIITNKRHFGYFKYFLVILGVLGVFGGGCHAFAPPLFATLIRGGGGFSEIKNILGVVYGVDWWGIASLLFATLIRGTDFRK